MKPLSNERKKNQSIKMKAKWKKCEEIGNILKIPKEIIFSNFNIHKGYFPAIRRGNPEIINHVHEILKKKISNNYDKNMPRKEQSQSDYVKRMVKQEKELIESKGSNIIRDQNSAIEELKIMFWVINKVGSVEKAKKLFQAAILALESMKEE